MTSKQDIITLYKNRGETPLECILRYKKDNPKYKNEKMTYAGRLDPLAEGLLLVLIGDECKNKEKYLGLEKTYEVDVLFGFSTDTYDLLGKVTSKCHSRVGGNPELVQFNLDSRIRGNDTIKELLNSFIGRFSQKYPVYSSKYFNKARSGELKDEEISSKNVEIKSIKLLSQKTISKKDLEKYIVDSINLVKGDFRQKEILKIWKKELSKSNCANKITVVELFAHGFKVVSIRVNCTSGTYMRSLANSIGEKVGIPALALNIKRIKVGKFKI
ncbi:MAG: hypothetical protein ABIF22_02880 [bacterium]